MAHSLNPLNICRPKTEGKRYYAPTSLEGIIQCPRRRHLQKLYNKKLTWPDFAKGTHLHIKLEELRTHPFRNLKGKRKRYSSAETFANVIANDWQRSAIKEGKIRGDKILWEYENQPYVMKNEIKEIALRVYPILMEEAETVIIFSYKTQQGNLSIRNAYDFEFVYKGRGFTGEIDEIRKEGDKIIIRDYKSGRWQFIENKKEYALQPTEYTFAVCYEALTNEQFRNALSISLEQAQEWIKNPEKMSDHVIFEYFMLDKCTEWNKEKKEYVIVEKNPAIRPSRKEFHYKELCLEINSAEASLNDMQDKNYYPARRGKHCDRCFYQKECDKMTENTDVHTYQATFDEYFISKRKNFIPLDQLKNLAPNKKEYKEAEFGFMKQVKKEERKK